MCDTNESQYVDENDCGTSRRKKVVSCAGGFRRTVQALIVQNVALFTEARFLQVFGIDCTGPCGDGILFKGGEWVPGGEYTQRLRVKNVSPKLKKLKYRLPTTKFFSLAYPEVITLSPGTVQVHRLLMANLDNMTRMRFADVVCSARRTQ